jgi:hypothetical protein
MKTKPSVKTASTPQSRIQSGASNAARRGSGEIGIVLYNWNTDQNVADFDLTAKEFSRIQAAFTKWADVGIAGRALPAFIRESLLGAANRELFPGSPMLELDTAVAQAKGLIRLALENQCYKEEEGGNDAGREVSHELAALLHSTTDRLNAAFDAAWSYASGRAA